MEIGNQIKKHRTRLKWSQETLAENAYVSRQTISNWENGKSYPDIHSLLILGKLFNISLDELVKGDVETMNNEISKNDTAKFNKLAWLLTAEYIIMIVSPLPLIKYLGWVGGAIWAAITAVSLFTAVKVEKLKKANDLTTYKEIKAYMEGKSLDEISAERIKKGSKNLMKALFGAVSAMIGFTVCILVAWLLK
ncbi:helix-turn-helix transcriptional regulator [Ruminococcus flavefaciens]|uniref:DNA-binding XRE family transcriptional regulator n=1 Tax=Ruminococcus flavefaciens TaxID=1265 RepID=A0A315XYB6_RUMFL|nr:helix-turn-helix transcriptional regulator [Ruminococcus flavefaciens]PWJ11541.1 DNA-binding XRE family transcriptional regulator [Ruminococcus flavefaciens]SSA50450.1 DNA-binding transcriptional regulator, XRE-family HTH domain [Ruminococcus flavefaciens]